MLEVNQALKHFACFTTPFATPRQWFENPTVKRCICIVKKMVIPIFDDEWVFQRCFTASSLAQECSVLANQLEPEEVFNHVQMSQLGLYLLLCASMGRLCNMEAWCPLCGFLVCEGDFSCYVGLFEVLTVICFVPAVCVYEFTPWLIAYACLA